MFCVSCLAWKVGVVGWQAQGYRLVESCNFLVLQVDNPGFQKFSLQHHLPAVRSFNHSKQGKGTERGMAEICEQASLGDNSHTASICQRLLNLTETSFDRGTPAISLMILMHSAFRPASPNGCKHGTPQPKPINILIRAHLH